MRLTGKLGREEKSDEKDDDNNLEAIILSFHDRAFQSHKSRKSKVGNQDILA